MMVPHMLPFGRKAIAVMIGLPPATFSQSCEVVSAEPGERISASLLDACRLRLRLLNLLHDLGGSLVDVEGELDVVVVDANAIVRLQRPSQ